MTYFCTLASGSSGNCHLYVSDRVCILIDAGTTTKYITNALAKLNLTLADITHILVTHGHSDHVGALPVLLKRTTAPVYCTADTADYIRFPEGRWAETFVAGECLNLCGCPVQTFATPHDISGSCGFVLGQGSERVTVCTDLGAMTGEIFAQMPQFTAEQTGEEAKTMLDELGFTKVTVEEEFHEEVPEGNVIRTNIPAGTKMDVTTAVVIYVSKGPEPTEPTETEPEMVTKEIVVYLPPEMEEPYSLTIMLGSGITVLEGKEIQPGTESITVSMTGYGVMYFEIYINGDYIRSEKVDFGA